MPEISQFDAFGLAPCPAQGDRKLSEKCWNHLHKKCQVVACECLCHDTPKRRRERAKPVQENMDFDSFVSIGVP